MKLRSSVIMLMSLVLSGCAYVPSGPTEIDGVAIPFENGASFQVGGYAVPAPSTTVICAHREDGDWTVSIWTGLGAATGAGDSAKLDYLDDHGQGQLTMLVTSGPAAGKQIDLQVAGQRSGDRYTFDVAEPTTQATVLRVGFECVKAS